MKCRIPTFFWQALSLPFSRLPEASMSASDGNNLTMPKQSLLLKMPPSSQQTRVPRRQSLAPWNRQTKKQMLDSLDKKQSTPANWTRFANLVLVALVIPSLWACCPKPLIQPTVKQKPAEACLRLCDPLEKPLDGSELSTRNWEYQAVDQFGQCRRLHAECRDWVSKQ